MFSAMACHKCNAANNDAVYCPQAILAVLEIVPNTQITSGACFILKLWRGINKICRYLIDCVLLHCSCLMTDVLQKVVLF